MAFRTRRWTLAEVHALPEDGNKYELIDGELLVTPAPTDGHETVLSRLTRILDPYVAANGLGYVYHPRAVFRVADRIELEPDLMVRQPHPGPERTWETAPVPSLVVEVVSPGTRRRDLVQKRTVYLENGIPEYWIVDEGARCIRVVRAGRADAVETHSFVWMPAGAAEPLVVEIERVLG